MDSRLRGNDKGRGWHRLSVIVMLLSMTACKVGPDYHRPPAPTPQAFKELQGWTAGKPADTIPRGAWWSVYHDAVLDDLEKQVAINNQNLKAYEAVYRQALAQVDETRAGLLPTLSLDTNATRQRTGGGSNGSTVSGTTLGATSLSGTSLSTTPITTSSSRIRNNYSLQANASWDLDLWGQIRRQIEAGRAGAEASAAQLASLTLSAQGQLAVTYFELRYQDQLAVLLKETVAAYQRSYQITKNRYEAGVSAKADVLNAQTQLQAAQSQAVNADVARAQYEHAIALLIGKAPAELTILPAPLNAEIPSIPVDVPSTLLERRPDIAQAERTIKQQNALIGATEALFYPSIKLSGLLGFSGSPLHSLVSKSNEIWTLAASGSELVFDAGERSAEVAAAKAAYDQAVANYRQTVLTAFQGVEDQLSTLRILETQAGIQGQTVQSATQTVQITLNQYKAGTADYTTVTTAQANALSARQTALAIQLNRLAASAQLIEALGGGWDQSQLPKP